MKQRDYFDYETIFDFIEGVDDEGVFRFTYPRGHEHILDSHKTEALREMMESRFREVSFMGIRFGRGTKWIDDFEAQAVKNGDGRWECRINLAKAMLLPGHAPKAELQELARFFGACREHIGSLPAEHGGDVQITNERDRNKRVYARFTCRQFLGNHRAEPVPASNQKLNDLVSQSPVLQAWLRELALTLGKLGPYSWWSVDESVVFREGERPRKNFLLERAREKYQSLQPTTVPAAASPAEPTPARPAAKP